MKWAHRLSPLPEPRVIGSGGAMCSAEDGFLWAGGRHTAIEEIEAKGNHFPPQSSSPHPSILSPKAWLHGARHSPSPNSLSLPTARDRSFVLCPFMGFITSGQEETGAGSQNKQESADRVFQAGSHSHFHPLKIGSLGQK